MRFFLLLRSWTLCVVLAGTSVYFGYRTVGVWTAKDRVEVGNPVQKAQKLRSHRRAAYRPNQGYNAYQVIAQKDLFSSDRKEYRPENPPVVSAAVNAPPSLDSRFALFGVIIDGPDKEALVSNVDRKKAQGKPYVWVKVGDKIGPLSISEIQSEHIVVTQAGSSYIISLSDQSHPLKRRSGRNVPKTAEPNTITIEKPPLKRPAGNGPKASS